MFQNLATNGDAHYDFNEFQPWVPIIQKTTSYFTYYLWGAGGKWQNGLKELKDRNLISVRDAVGDGRVFGIRYSVFGK